MHSIQYRLLLIFTLLHDTISVFFHVNYPEIVWWKSNSIFCQVCYNRYMTIQMHDTRTCIHKSCQVRILLEPSKKGLERSKSSWLKQNCYIITKVLKQNYCFRQVHILEQDIEVAWKSLQNKYHQSFIISFTDQFFKQI